MFYVWDCFYARNCNEGLRMNFFGMVWNIVRCKYYLFDVEYAYLGIARSIKIMPIHYSK